jgi:tRNA threonylcarbamoyladenosine modification (KEOPS) complex  Pcc1 subunit
MDNKLEFFISINFDSEDITNLVYQSILPEIQSHRYDRSQVSLLEKKQKIVVIIKAQDVSAANASISSILRWISMITETITIFPDQSSRV